MGVGQLRNNRERSIDHAREPLDLISAAARLALADTGGLPPELIDGVDVVRVMTWDYDDLPGVVAATLGCTPRRTEHTDAGGNQPVAPGRSRGRSASPPVESEPCSSAAARPVPRSSPSASGRRAAVEPFAGRPGAVAGDAGTRRSGPSATG